MATVQEAKKLLDDARADCKTAKGIADREGEYASAKKRVEDTYAALNKLPAAQKSLLTKELEQLKTQIELATSKVELERKPDEAITVLKQAEKDASQAKTKADMHANLHSPSPNPAYVKLLMAESGGTKVLDDMVANMDESTNRKVLEIALEARFNVEMKQFLSEDGITVGTPPRKVHGTADNTAPDKSVKRIYELLLKVPESHARDNAKVKEIQRFQEDTGGAAYGGGITYLNCGRAGANFSHNQGDQLGSPDYFPDGVDPDCQPRADAKDKDVRYFDWATLHEVGHAVDDKHKFMKNNQAGDDFGGWEVYGADVTEPAKAAEGKFKYDLTYITETLQGKTPATPAKPDKRTQKEWDDAKAAFDQWAATVMNGRLWWEGDNCKKVLIGERVYHRAYDKPPQWVSYKLTARSKGIHGYQFRAPGEWFAELYAAYYMECLKPEHPAVKDWLPAKLT